MAETAAPATAAPTTTAASTVATAIQQPESTVIETTLGWFTGIGGILSLILLIVFHFGAAKLSYDVNQSVGWAVVSFFFATLYYPYYAFAHSTRRQSSLLGLLGGRRRKH
jgi:hypothetical protein